MSMQKIAPQFLKVFLSSGVIQGQQNMIKATHLGQESKVPHAQSSEGAVYHLALHTPRVAWVWHRHQRARRGEQGRLQQWSAMTSDQILDWNKESMAKQEQSRPDECPSTPSLLPVGWYASQHYLLTMAKYYELPLELKYKSRKRRDSNPDYVSTPLPMGVCNQNWNVITK